MEKTKGYITTLANTISLVIECSEKKTNVSFVEVLKTINQLDISDVINEMKKIDHTFFDWLDVANYYPESLLERWNRHKRDVNEYISYVDEQSKKYIERYGKAPQPIYIKELVEAISVKLEQLQRCKLVKKTHLDLKGKKKSLNYGVKKGWLEKRNDKYIIPDTPQWFYITFLLDVIFGGGKVVKEWSNGKTIYVYHKGETKWVQLEKYFGTKHNFSSDIKRMLSERNQSERIFLLYTELNGYLSEN